MRRSLLLLVLMSLGATLAVPFTATAAARHTSCNLIKDPVGDTQSVGPDNDQELDIVSADVAANDSQLTTVVRLAALSAEDPTQPAGRTYEFDFSVGDVNFETLGTLLLGGDNFEAYIASSPPPPPGQSGGRAATGIGPMTAVVDTKRKELRLSAPISIFEKYAHFDNAPMSKLAAFTYRAHGENTDAYTGGNINIGSSLGLGVDGAYSKATIYKDWRSCVTPGH